MRFNTVGFIMDYESGNLSDEKVVEGFQHLIDENIVWDLQGSYGRTARVLIKAGLCHEKSDPAVLAHIRKQQAACGSNCSE
jgi:hypothetical protein